LLGILLLPQKLALNSVKHILCACYENVLVATQDLLAGGMNGCDARDLLVESLVEIRAVSFIAMDDFGNRPENVLLYLLLVSFLLLRRLE